MKSHIRNKVAKEITRLEDLNSWELRLKWQHLHRRPAPKRISQNLLMRGIAYKIQEQSYGGLSKPVLRKIATLGTTTDPLSKHLHQHAVALRPGIQLVREWHDETHIVDVLDKGFRWRGTTYRSLSIIAKEITGAHWSGPRFFGVSSRKSFFDE